MMKKFHFTIDCDFIPKSDIVFCDLLSFVDKNNLSPTFFISGKFAEMYPSLARELAVKYEIGSHGLYHGLCPTESFGNKVSLYEKYALIEKSTDLVEKYSGVRPVIFRAPCLKISDSTFSVLKELGYKIDSSIPSRRFDFFNGNINNLKYFKHSTAPEYLDNGIFEIPPSAYFLPLNMRFVKVFGIKVLIKFLKSFFLNKSTIVFYMHPSELVENRYILDYPREEEYFYKNGGIHLLDKLQILVDYLKANEFNSVSMKQNLKEYEKCLKD